MGGDNLEERVRVGEREEKEDEEEEMWERESYVKRERRTGATELVEAETIDVHAGRTQPTPYVQELNLLHISATLTLSHDPSCSDPTISAPVSPSRIYSKMCSRQCPRLSFARD